MRYVLSARACGGYELHELAAHGVSRPRSSALPPVQLRGFAGLRRAATDRRAPVHPPIDADRSAPQTRPLPAAFSTTELDPLLGLYRGSVLFSTTPRSNPSIERAAEGSPRPNRCICAAQGQFQAASSTCWLYFAHGPASWRSEHDDSGRPNVLNGARSSYDSFGHERRYRPFCPAVGELKRPRCITNYRRSPWRGKLLVVEYRERTIRHDLLPRVTWYCKVLVNRSTAHARRQSTQPFRRKDPY